MSSRRPVRVRAEVVLDPVAWAKVYGTGSNRNEITLDMQEWAHNLLTEAAREAGTLSGENSEWSHDYTP